MTLLLLWLDGCDILFASQQNMPNLHKSIRTPISISTKARLPAISAKAIRQFMFNDWDLNGTFENP